MIGKDDQTAETENHRQKEVKTVKTWRQLSKRGGSALEDKKKRIGVIFGGKSGEYEVSLLSAASVIRVLNTQKYEPGLYRHHQRRHMEAI